MRGFSKAIGIGIAYSIVFVCFASTLIHPSLAEGLRVGAAKVKITPEEIGWLGGYGHRDRPAEGVAADLWTRALAFDDGSGNRRVLVSADIHIFTRRLHEEIVKAARTRFGLEQGDIMLIATHTHSGPALPEAFDPRICWNLTDGEYQTLVRTADRIRDQVLQAMDRALSELQPARLSFARGETRFGVNRRVYKGKGEYDFGANPDGVADPDVPVLVVESLEGKPLAVVFTYACHNTTIRRGNEGFYHYHPDYSGVAAAEIERQLPGSTALYVTGCAGDIDPQPQGPVKQAELHGQTLSVVVLAAVKGDRRAVGAPSRARYREIKLPLSSIPSREKYLELAKSPSPYLQRHAQRVLDQMGAGGVAKEVPYPIQAWWFGNDFALVGLAGEVCVDYALRLKKELGIDRIWPVAYANEVPCYIPSERVLAEGGYEAGWDSEHGPGVPSRTGSMTFYGFAAPLAPGVENRIITAVHALLKER